MNDVSLGTLGAILFFLILLSAFFSSAETGMMSLNRYKLRHQANKGHRSAQRIIKLLEQPDRLIGVILIGNNFVNLLASSIATIIGIRLLGDAGIALATGALLFIILVFAEVSPKTMAALHPERIAFPASLILSPLLKLLYPFVWLINIISNGLLRIVGIKKGSMTADHLSSEELRTVVKESASLVPRRNQGMLINILDLEKVTVDDIMVPRNEIAALNIDDDIEEILSQLKSSQHTRLPVYKGDINQIIGILHIRNATRFLDKSEINKATILQYTREPYFIPESTPLHTQLLNFQKSKRRIGFAVDEYGDVLGLVTLEDILEEIVGEFTTNMADTSKDIYPQDDGSFLIDGTATVREINRALNWQLPTEGPKTLNGLILEALESIPDNSVCVSVDDYRMETIQTKNNIVKTVRVSVKQ